MEKIEIEKTAKEVVKDKFLKSAGIMIKNGEIAKQYRQDELKHNWSEEDEIEFTHILKTLKSVSEEQQAKGYNNLISSVNWLKSLKDRVCQQNDWKPSDLQIEALESATENCAYSEYQDCLRELIIELKKL